MTIADHIAALLRAAENSAAKALEAAPGLTVMRRYAEEELVSMPFILDGFPGLVLHLHGASVMSDGIAIHPLFWLLQLAGFPRSPDENGCVSEAEGWTLLAQGNPLTAATTTCELRDAHGTVHATVELSNDQSFHAEWVAEIAKHGRLRVVCRDPADADPAAVAFEPCQALVRAVALGTPESSASGPEPEPELGVVARIWRQLRGM